MIESQFQSERRSDSSHDAGVSFIELLIAVVLLGTAVLGTLALLRTSIVSSAVNEDQAVAHAWLQSLADELYREAYQPCNPGAGVGTTEIGNTYESLLTSPPPLAWSGASFDIVDVQLWGTDDTTGLFEWGTDCQSYLLEDPGYDQQLVEIEVTSPDGSFDRNVEVIRGR